MDLQRMDKVLNYDNIWQTLIVLAQIKETMVAWRKFPNWLMANSSKTNIWITMDKVISKLACDHTAKVKASKAMVSRITQFWTLKRCKTLISRACSCLWTRTIQICQTNSKCNNCKCSNNYSMTSKISFNSKLMLKCRQPIMVVGSRLHQQT